MGAYQPPDHIAVVNLSGVSQQTVAFWVEAVRAQLLEASQSWKLPAPGVFLYGPESTIARSEGAAIVIVDHLVDLGMSGFHNALGGVVGIEESGATPDKTLSHEALELWGNLNMDRWVEGPDGLFYALELCDAVEWDSYVTQVKLFNRMEEVSLCNYLLPAWFAPGAPEPYDRMGLVGRPFGLRPGAYQIAKNKDGEMVPLRFAATRTPPPPGLPTSRRTRIAKRIGSAAPTTPQPSPPPEGEGC